MSWEPHLSHNRPHLLMLNTIEGFGIIYETGKGVVVIFSAFFEYIAYVENVVSCASIWSEACLNNINFFLKLSFKSL